MFIFCAVAIIIGIYFFTVFIVLRLVVPFMGFRKPALPVELPSEIKAKILDLEGKSATQKEYLELAYNFVTARFRAGRMDTVFYAPLAFRKNILQIWNSPGYAHCNTQNYLLYILLAESKFFVADDITFQCVFFNFFIHQYLKVKVGDVWVDADPAGASIRGNTLGTRLKIFG